MEEVQVKAHKKAKRSPYLPFQHNLEECKSWETTQIKRPLTFLHIPKTGGTSVVTTAANFGYAWGECMFPLMVPQLNCPDRPVNFFMEMHPSNNKSPINNMTDLYHPEQFAESPPNMYSWWHLPLQYLPNDQSHTNPYQHQDLFAVIRNPYRRAVSQYYYRCWRFRGSSCYLGKGKNNKHNNKDTPQQMNAVLQHLIQKQQKAPLGSKDYFFHDGHWIPQAHYVYNVTSTTSRSAKGNSQNSPLINKDIISTSRLVQHVLHFEYLQDQFASLMRAYQLNISLPQEKLNSRKEFPTNCTVADLTKTTMQLIEDVYRDDFELGGYPILSHRFHNNKPEG
ncbi:sulfotransferase family protein [Nitzschia inconspicua]|uniref:Sulfotransferase family protein n=1 Tax=Nitzschia inconspicua TaxID=303405 RepID=A0A9K3PFH2_9STRA|nr:sulfotransferase family protein [Nitzschia inconspicua]